MLSIVVICFWQFRHTESPLLRRVFSVGNVNDFSWRNRVTAWQGAGRMMLDKPLAGFGWGKAEEAYRKEYRADRLEETAAIQLNDYLMLGTSAGVLALVCFLAYIAFARRQALGCARGSCPLPTSDLALQTSVAASGALVLLIGFWFDGGLFKLPTCVVFWMLVELARGSSRGDEAQIQSDQAEKVRASSRRLLRMNKWHITLRCLAGMVALLAIGQTVLHLGLPQCGVSERTLAIARKWLVPAREKSDFEFLAARPIWSDKPLKTLLQHAHLAGYNRELVNWKLDDSIYQSFVLAPEIDPAFDGTMNWRRPLWEHFYPRIRKEGSPETAAGVVIRELRNRVKIATTDDPAKTIAEMWVRGKVNAPGFESLSVAALRSVGIPARLSASGEAEVWTGAEWKPRMSLLVPPAAR